MAATKSTSVLFQKLGQRLVNAHKTYAGAETTYSSFGDPPAGIDNGIAQLVEAKIDVHKEGDKKGEPFFFVRGVIRIPKEHDGVPCDGIGVSHMEPLYDTPTRKVTTAEGHVGEMYNLLRRLGVDTNAIDPTNLDSTLSTLKAQSPHFKFRTYKIQKKTATDPKYNPKYDAPDAPAPRVNVEIGSVVEYNPEEGADDGVDDGTAPPAPASPRATGKPGVNGTTAKPPVVKPTANPVKTNTPKTGKVAPDVETTYSDQEDLDALLARAGDQDAAATARLSELAQAAGYTEAEVDAASSWDDVVAMVNNPKESGDAEDDDGSGVPAVDDVFYYHPTNPKTKQPDPKKRTEVKVTKVDADAGKVDIVNLSNPKEKWAGVAFDRLVSE